ncbi:hypothetical protein AB0K89_13390 [Streptomyces cinnamoneus]|uniref:hypothetical protein n=1 Tax=Streptomyces cinnamoneus TaxID=53446 RepID=UPI00343D3FC6
MGPGTAVLRLRRAARASVLTALLLLSSTAPVRAVASPGDETPSGPRLVLGDASVEVGDTAGFAIEGMAGAWDEVDVSSPALTGTLRLHPESKGASHSADPRMPENLVRVRSGLPPGSYEVTATSHGRPVASAQLKVVAQGPARIRRFALLPKTEKARAGEKVQVVLADDHAAPDEKAVTVTSRAFGGSRTVKEAGPDSPDNPGCKCDDGATVYAAWIDVPKGTPSGTYDVTVVSHHGRKKTTQRLSVTGDDDSATWVPWACSGGAGAVVLAGGAWLVASRRRRRLRAESDAA